MTTSDESSAQADEALVRSVFEHVAAPPRPTFRDALIDRLLRELAEGPPISDRPVGDTELQEDIMTVEIPSLPMTTGSRWRGRWPARLGAVAAAAAVIAAVVVITRDDTTTSVQTDQPAVMPAGASLPELAVTSCCRGRDVQPGRYALPDYAGPQLSLDIPAGWRLVNDAAASYLALVNGPLNDLGAATRAVSIFALEEGKSGTDLVAAIEADPTLEIVSGPTQTEVAGFEATLVDATVSFNSDQPVDVDEVDIVAGTYPWDVLNDFTQVVASFGLRGWVAEEQVRFLVVDVDEIQVLAMIEAAQDDFEAFADDAEAVLVTLEPTG